MSVSTVTSSDVIGKFNPLDVGYVWHVRCDHVTIVEAILKQVFSWVDEDGSFTHEGHFQGE